MSVTYLVSQEYLDFYYRKYQGRAKGAKAILSLATGYEECLKLVAQGEMTEDPRHLMAADWDFSGAVICLYPQPWLVDDWIEYEDEERGCSGGICSCCGRTRD